MHGTCAGTVELPPIKDVTSNCVPAESNLPVSLKNVADPGFDRISSGGIWMGMTPILGSFCDGPGLRVTATLEVASGGSGKFDSENSLRSEVAEKGLLREVKDGVNTIVFRVLSLLGSVTICTPLAVTASGAVLWGLCKPRSSEIDLSRSDCCCMSWSIGESMSLPARG